MLDGKGELVRRISSTDTLDPTAVELARELIPQYWIKPPRSLPVSAGMHRWVWNLRYAPPVSVTRGYPISAAPHITPQLPEGPLAVPGRYLVRLTVDGHHFEAPLTVEPDPRVHLTPGELEEQLRLARRLAELLTDSSRMVLSARSEQAQLKALAPTAAEPADVQAYTKRLAAFLEANTENEAPSQQPGAKQERPEPQPVATSPSGLKDVQEHIATLYTEVTRGDATPTAAQTSATETLARQLTGFTGSWQQLQADLVAVNKSLRAGGAPAVRADLAPPRDLNVADED